MCSPGTGVAAVAQEEEKVNVCVRRWRCFPAPKELSLETAASNTELRSHLEGGRLREEVQEAAAEGATQGREQRAERSYLHQKMPVAQCGGHPEGDIQM